MILHGKRIRNFERHFGYLKDRQTVVFGVIIRPELLTKMEKTGFTSPASLNTAVLPASNCGPICRFNAEGKNLIRRDLPKETAYRQIEWTWNEWHGKESVEKTGIKDVPYQRYPREFVPPPAIELAFVQSIDGSNLIICPAMHMDLANSTPLVHAVNVLLEIFGECSAFTEGLDAIVRAPITRLNWDFLPPGNHPWPHLQTALTPMLNRLTVNKKKVVSWRFKTINSYIPDFVATGRAGFTGYVVFGFTAKNLYICESMHTGNATYVFADDWAALSQMTKAEILNAALHEDRIIHREGWVHKIHDLLD